MMRYLSGLCVTSLGLCGGGWLLVAAVAFGGSAGPAREVNLATGAGLAAVSLAALVCWAAAWRRRMRVDGVLMDRFLLVTRREARRNRRELSRDVRRTARLARRNQRAARRGARQPAPGAGTAGTGESPAELLAELRALLGPLLAAVEAEPAVTVRSRVPASAGSDPAREPAAVPLPYGDRLVMSADGEEAW